MLYSSIKFTWVLILPIEKSKTCICTFIGPVSILASMAAWYCSNVLNFGLRCALTFWKMEIKWLYKINQNQMQSLVINRPSHLYFVTRHSNLTWRHFHKNTVLPNSWSNPTILLQIKFRSYRYSFKLHCNFHVFLSWFIQ